nr:MAG TPA: hypothetical protein [Caudoviricetes sp.]
MLDSLSGLDKTHRTILSRNISSAGSEKLRRYRWVDLPR